MPHASRCCSRKPKRFADPTQLPPPQFGEIGWVPGARCVRDGRRDLADAVLAPQRETILRDDDNAGFTRDVGHALTRAIQAFGDGRYAEVVALIRPVRSSANRFGGSHAQRDVIDLTLIEAALRAGEHDLAAALAAERVAAKPAGPLARLLARRAGAVGQA